VDVFGSEHVNGVLDTGANILRPQIGVVIPDYLGKGKTFAD
jgi:hypothetical protein